MRAATPADVPDIAALYVAREGGEVGEASLGVTSDLNRMAAVADRWVCVAHVDGRFAGYGRAKLRPGSPGVPEGWFLLGVVVEPGARRRGVARALTEARFAWLVARGVTEVRSFVSAQNRASLALHHATGFEEVRRGDVVPGVTFTGGVGVLLRRSLP
ncbi:MAG: GNAT family N-acetyltransferase [Alphaproteobacteria bacterium]|nr:GNAT family N-acetyltransferase [Alphaproteobacteria bacterium]